MILIRKPGMSLSLDCFRAVRLKSSSTKLGRGAEKITERVISPPSTLPIVIFSHLIALFLHRLSDRDPLVYMMTIPTDGSTKLLKESNLRFFYNNLALTSLISVATSLNYKSKLPTIYRKVVRTVEDSIVRAAFSILAPKFEKEPNRGVIKS